MDQVSEGGADLIGAVENTGTGAILYDRTAINHISTATFRASSWQRAEPVRGSLRSAGRGNTMIVSDGRTEFVLRHYRRGGLPGRVNPDLYLWSGEERTRAFAEWRMLARLREMGLPVPRPAAARYCRAALLFYRADLLTVREPGIRALSDRLIGDPAGEAFWRGAGETIYRFHEAGVCHADLNAYNIQVDHADRLFLLDFDRGRFLRPGPWQQRNLARLYRSLSKIRRLEPRVMFSETNWSQFLQGYSSAARSR